MKEYPYMVSLLYKILRVDKQLWFYCFAIQITSPNVDITSTEIWGFCVSLLVKILKINTVQQSTQVYL